MTSTLLLFLTLAWGDRPYLDAAEKAATWLQSVAVETEHGKRWPPQPDYPDKLAGMLYNGDAGTILFFLALYKTSGETRWLDEATAGANQMLADLPEKVSEQTDPGLYTGLAGIGFVLEEVGRASGKPAYRQGAQRVVRLIEATELNKVTDIISGVAGIGLFLLYMTEHTNDPGTLAQATRLGDQLLGMAHEKPGGLDWKMHADYPATMPNFSHGTAGVAYFLARLGAASKKQVYLDAAQKGAAYIQSLAASDGLIYHHEPEGEDLFYLGWCHGPAGTARLYYQLWKQTGEKRWRDALDGSLAGLHGSDIPEKRTPGFWNNVGQCCGSAGVAECALDAHRATGNAEHLDLANRLTADLLARADKQGPGLKWTQAEHRVKPELLLAQTGYMQGAAGIGIWLLRLDAFKRGKSLGLRLPDSPYP